MSQVQDRGKPTISTRLGVSLPSAVGALLFAGALAFGSTLVDTLAPLQDTSPTALSGADQDGLGDGGDGGDAKPATYQEDKQQPDHNRPDKTPVPAPTPKPEPVEEPKPQPVPPAPPAPVSGLALSLQTFDGKVKLAWSVYDGDGFAHYKLVRSSDATVTWPAGAGDSLIAYASDRWDTLYKDFPPCGTTWHYAVFAVMGGETGYATLAASNVASAAVQCVVKPTPPPPPPVHPMAFSVEIIGGQAHLTWEQCTSAGFGVYKVVRSQTNTDPKYPTNEGTELIAAIGDSSVTSLVDGNVSSGQTWHYRVLAMGNDGYGWYPLGMTPVITVTIP